MDDTQNEFEAVQTVEQSVEQVEQPVDKSDKLSNREALEQALAKTRETQAEESQTPAQREPTRKEVQSAVDADLEPPAEFSAKGKTAWRNKDIRGIQEEYSRIHTERTREIHRAQSAERQAREDAKTWKQLGEMAAPYIEARGAEGVTPQQAMMEALALVNELRKQNPATTKAELKKLGIDLDAAPSADNSQGSDEKTALQERLERLERVEQQRSFEATAQAFGQAFDKLTSLKTRTGEVVFPDLLDNSEEGKQFARELGSLTQDATFQRGVLRRFPDADLSVFVREAYKYLGGKVSGEPVTVSTNNNPKQIEKSRRAAASSPQGATMRSRNDSSALAGKLSGRAALVKALEEWRGR